MIYYLDTCIWLNIFKKEKKFWKQAYNIIQNNNLIVSTIVLKELKFTLKNKFNIVLDFFKEDDYIDLIKTTNEDYNLARNFENEDFFKLSFYDYLHVAICVRNKFHLITRDYDLIKFAKKKIKVNKPEDLLN